VKTIGRSVGLQNKYEKITGALVLMVASAVLLNGCVPMSYTRSITVHKDANGNITGTDEYESITESHSETPKIKELKGSEPFKYLK